MRAYLRRTFRLGRLRTELDVMDDGERVHKRKVVTLTPTSSSHEAPIDSDRSSLRTAKVGRLVSWPPIPCDHTHQNHTAVHLYGAQFMECTYLCYRDNSKICFANTSSNNSQPHLIQNGVL